MRIPLAGSSRHLRARTRRPHARPTPSPTIASGTRGCSAGTCSAASATSRGSAHRGSARHAGSRAAAPGLCAPRSRAARSRSAPASAPSTRTCHSAVEFWLTRRFRRARREAAHRPVAQRPGRLRPAALPQGPRCSTLHARWPRRWPTRCSRFARRHRRALWPGYTHQRRAMPSSAGLWAAAYAEGLLDTIESLPALWAQGRSLAARQRGRLRRAAAARPGGRGPGARLRRARPQRGRRCRTGAASSRPRCSSGAAQLGHELAKLLAPT